ncbi:MAG: efflux RND transporter periplasmic adaptor subunit [Myxococcota bacterium]
MRLALLATWALLAACDAGEGPPEAAAPLPVSVVPARLSSSHTVERSFQGIVRSARTAAVGFERDGLVVALEADDGQSVVRDQVLGRLDLRRLRSEMDRLTANLRQVEAERELSARTTQRIEALERQDYASKQDRDESALRLNALEARRDEVQAAIDRLEVEISKSILRAPFEGRVVRRRVDEGAVVAPGQVVFEIQEDGVAEAEVGVSTREWSRLKVGETYPLRIRGVRVQGVLTSLVDRVERRTRTVTAILRLPDPPGSSGSIPASSPSVEVDSAEPAAPADAGSDAPWIPEESVELLITQEVPETGSRIPLTALTQGPRGSWAVYMLPAGSTTGPVELAAVEVLHIDGPEAFVAGTLEDGDQVITGGVHRIVPGQIVRVASDSMVERQP